MPKIKIWIDDLETESDGKEFGLIYKGSDISDPQFDTELSCYVRSYVENYISRHVAKGSGSICIDGMQVCVKFKKRIYVVDATVKYRPVFKIGKARLM